MRRSPSVRRVCIWGLHCGSFTLTFILLAQRLFLEEEEELSSVRGIVKPSKPRVVHKNVSDDILKVDRHDFKIMYDGYSSNEERVPDSEQHGLTGQTFVEDVYLFSAVVGNSSAFRSWDTVVLQVWEHRDYDNLTFDCCIKYQSGVILSVKDPVKVHWSYKGRCKMPAKQYHCPNPSFNLPDRPTGISMVGRAGESRCEDREDLFIRPNFAYANSKGIAICTKLLYGNISADDVMTWFELHRLLGASKVLVHTYDLNADATRVLQYYQSQGFVEFSPFDLPDSPHWVKEWRGHVRSIVGGKNFQTWNDEQILIYDCLEKLKGYKYLVVLDIDEYLVPNHNKRLPEFFDELWDKNPYAAGFRFLVQLHITSWGATDTRSQFTVGRYLNSTAAMSDRTKHVTRPDRLIPGGLSTHQFYPQWDKEYRRFSVKREEAVIHHYRDCRHDWKKRRNITCMALDRFRDPTVADILAPVERELIKTRSVIHSRN